MAASAFVRGGCGQQLKSRRHCLDVRKALVVGIDQNMTIVATAPTAHSRCCWILAAACAGSGGGAYYFGNRPLSATEFQSRYGPTAFIAGASEGLGFAWADFLGARGINLVIIARHASELEAAAAALRTSHDVTVETHVLDLASSEVVPFAHAVFFNRSDIRLLVYNAAYTGYRAGFFASDSLEMAHTAIDVNVKAVLSLAHPFLAARQSRAAAGPSPEGGGGLVLMSSMAGLVGSAHLSVYASTKAWTTAFATGLYDEMRPSGFDVLSCIAGATTTPNYLEEALPSRSTFIEQTPSEVVDECAGALGRTPTRATGLVNRFAQALITRLLPTRVAVQIMSDGARSTTKFELVEPK